MRETARPRHTSPATALRSGRVAANSRLIGPPRTCRTKSTVRPGSIGARHGGHPSARPATEPGWPGRQPGAALPHPPPCTVVQLLHDCRERTQSSYCSTLLNQPGIQTGLCRIRRTRGTRRVRPLRAYRTARPFQHLWHSEGRSNARLARPRTGWRLSRVLDPVETVDLHSADFPFRRGFRSVGRECRSHVHRKTRSMRRGYRRAYQSRACYRKRPSALTPGTGGMDHPATRRDRALDPDRGRMAAESSPRRTEVARGHIGAAQNEQEAHIIGCRTSRYSSG